MCATLKQWFSNLAACWNHLGVLNDPSKLPVTSESPAHSLGVSTWWTTALSVHVGPIFPSGCEGEGKLGVALESLQGLRELT